MPGNGYTISVDFCATIPGTDLTWFGKLSTSTETGKKTFTTCQIRVT